MGKATIVSNEGDGRYTIKLDYGKTQRDARVTKLQARLAELAPEIVAKQAKVTEAQGKQDDKTGAVRQAIDDYVQATQDAAATNQALLLAGQQLQAVATSSNATPAEIAAAQQSVKNAEAAQKAAQKEVTEQIEAQAKVAAELQKAKQVTAGEQVALDLLNDEKTRINKNVAYLNGLQLEESREAWCADFTDDATGEVATIEIPGESALVLVKPQAPAHTPGDGVLAAREMQSPEQVFWNAAVLPGWQKWKPTYRRGVITAIDTDANTADVTLTEDKSSAQNLKVNQTPTLTGVPVKYMDCDALAFTVGDACVVHFEGMDWGKPKVIGFEYEPKPCAPSGILIALSTLSGNGVTERLLLTPRVQPGTRISTGEWRVVRPKGYLSGGKAVNTNSTGKVYFTGVLGNTSVLSWGSDGTNVNMHAYRSEDWGEWPPGSPPIAWRGGKQQCLVKMDSAGTNESPLPFVIEGDDGKMYAAQLVFRYDDSFYKYHEIDLRVGPIKTTPTQFVGPVVATVTLPKNFFVSWTEITFRPDGRQARAVGTAPSSPSSDNPYAKLTLHISPTSMSESVEVMQGSRTDYNWAVPVAVNVLNVISANPLHTTEYTNYNGNSWGLTADGAQTPVPGSDRHVHGTGTSSSYSGDYPVYAFGPKGQDFDYVISEGFSGGSVRFASYTSEAEDHDFPGDSYHRGSSSSTISRIDTGKKGKTSPRELMPLFPDLQELVTGYSLSYQNSGNFNIDRVAGTEVQQGSTSQTEITRIGEGSFVAGRFFDLSTEFLIYVRTDDDRVRTDTYTSSWSLGSPASETESSTITGSKQKTLVVSYKGQELLRRELDPESVRHEFIVHAATDPLTGAFIVNLVYMFKSIRTGSWIYVVDDTGVKTIHDIIPDLPDMVSIRSARDLVSV